MINLHWLELPMARTIFRGPKGVGATEVRLYYHIVRPAKKDQPAHQRQSDQSSHGILWVAKDPKRLQENNKDCYGSSPGAQAILQEMLCPGLVVTNVNVCLQWNVSSICSTFFLLRTKKKTTRQ